MSIDFDRSKATIAAMEQDSSLLTANTLFQLLLDTVRDYRSNDNNAQSIQTARIDPDEEAMYDLLADMNQLFAEILRFHDAHREQFRDAEQQLEAVLEKKTNQLTSDKNDLSKAQDNLSDLRDTEQDLERTRGHLLEKKREAAEVQQKIDVLSDPALDTIEAQAAALEQDLHAREERNMAAQARIGAANAAIEDAKKKEPGILSEQQKKEAEKEKLTKELEEAKANIGAIEKWIEQMQAELTKLREDNKEKIAMVKALLNIAEAATEPEMREKLQKLVDEIRADLAAAEEPLKELEKKVSEMVQEVNQTKAAQYAETKQEG